MRRRVFISIYLYLFVLANVHSTSVVAQVQFGQESENGVALDLDNLPKHLRNSTLIKFLRNRALKTLPNSFPQLMRELLYEDVSPVRLYAPRGRSVQRAFTDEYMPRRIVASYSANKIAQRVPIGFEDYTKLPGSDYEGRLFFWVFRLSKQNGDHQLEPGNSYF